MTQGDRKLTSEDLRARRGEELPGREAMSLLDANATAPVDAAAALNVPSDNSTVAANASQSADIEQSR